MKRHKHEMNELWRKLSPNDISKSRKEQIRKTYGARGPHPPHRSEEKPILDEVDEILTDMEINEFGYMLLTKDMLKYKNDGISIASKKLTEMIQAGQDATIKLNYPIPNHAIESQMKANGDLSPWKRFLYLFRPNLELHARLQALVDIKAKEENFTFKTAGDARTRPLCSTDKPIHDSPVEKTLKP